MNRQKERSEREKSFSLFERSRKGSDQKSEIFGELHLIKFPWQKKKTFNIEYLFCKQKL
jgi:hypothetical protein